jgi:hypothetical protein
VEYIIITTTTYIFVVVDIILPLFLAAILSNGLGLSNPISAEKPNHE